MYGGTTEDMGSRLLVVVLVEGGEKARAVNHLLHLPCLEAELSLPKRA